MFKKQNLVAVLLSLFLGCFIIHENAMAQIGITPTDTTVCPGNTYTIHARFSTSNAPNNSDDQFSAATVDLGFPFVFYGNTYTQCRVSSNNFITFNLSKNGYSSYTWTGALGAGDLNNSIFFPFHDIDFYTTAVYNPNPGRINYQTFGSAPNRVFVIEFCTVPLFSCNSLLVTDQLILYEGTNVIEMHLKDKPVCTGWLSGSAVEGIKFNNNQALVPGRDVPNTPWTATNDARRFTPNASGNYTIDTIPFNPFHILTNVDSNQIQWFEAGNPNSIHTGASLTVTANVNIPYYVAQVSGQACSDTGVTVYHDTSWVHFGTGYDTINTAICANESYNFYGRILTQAGQYDTLMSSVLGCDSIITLNLTVNPMPNVILADSNDFKICKGDQFRIKLGDPSQNTTYQWMINNSPIVNANESSYLVRGTGDYAVVGTTNKGCTDTSATVHVDLFPRPSAHITAISPNPICSYDTLSLSVLNPQTGDGYTWTPAKLFRRITGNEGSKVSGIFLDPATMVVLTAINQYGCTAEDSVLVTTKPCNDVFVPNAFTPNGDGVNDFFKPQMQTGQVLLTLKVFNRLGQLVYNDNNPETGWNGNFRNGKPAPQDTYMYRMEYTGTDGKLYHIQGSVDLLR